MLIRIYVFNVWSGHTGGVWSIAETYLAHNIGRIYNVTTLELVISISSAFQYRYEKLGNILQKQCETTGPIKLKKVGQIFRMLTKANKCFNLIFG